ncbi:MAG: CRISPR-associated endonuclease Cas2 [Actinomycetaceae bacterium]|nr:CRISPR-associated endonuclease Cas2 [Actinomycetaceae bacterium]
MWTLVMFDLPVGTAAQRRRATRFRNMLLDLGFSMVQYSVYVRYVPTGAPTPPIVRQIKENVPPDGLVRVIYITDRQWSRMLNFWGSTQVNPEPAPQQLQFF